MAPRAAGARPFGSSPRAARRFISYGTHSTTRSTELPGKSAPWHARPYTTGVQPTGGTGLHLCQPLQSCCPVGQSSCCQDAQTSHTLAHCTGESTSVLRDSGMIDLRRSHLLCCFKCMFSRKLMASHRIPQSVSDAAETPGHAHACRRLWPRQEKEGRRRWEMNSAWHRRVTVACCPHQ